MIKLAVLFLLAVSAGCAINAAQSGNLQSGIIPQTSKNESIKKSENLLRDDDFVKSLSLNGYDFSVKTIRSKNSRNNLIEDTYAAISRNGKRLAVYNDFPKSGLAEYRFKILGNSAETQVIIETTMPKFWRYRIAALSPKFEVIFDSDKYNLGHDLRISDIDQDGIQEISLDLMTFDYFGVNYRKGWITPPIIFKFDKTRNRYVFANKEFKHYLLRNVDFELIRINKINSEKRTNPEYDREIYSAVMNVFLNYIYTGQEKEAWQIFEKYSSTDNVEIKAEIKKYLAKDSLYHLAKSD